MKESVLSTSERSFILNAISERSRLDGRSFNDFRDLSIHFGSDWGCCFVTLGETKVFAQVSCDVQQPKPTSPNEGLLFVFVELNPMAAPHFEVGRHLDIAIQLNRLLEKCIKDSRCVDLETLCITAEDKVWAIRIDINILNHKGNLVDAVSVAALTALSHFRRPDVTTVGEDINIHDPSQRDSLPVTLHHYPVCVSYALFNKGKYVLADPTDLEERVSECQIVFGINSSRELCTLHMDGHATVTTPLVLQYASHAAVRALEVVIRIKEELAKDIQSRNSGIRVGIWSCIANNTVSQSLLKDTCIQLNRQRLNEGIENTTIRETMKNYEDTICEADGETTVADLSTGSTELLKRSLLSIQSDRQSRVFQYEYDGSLNSSASYCYSCNDSDSFGEKSNDIKDIDESSSDIEDNVADT